jgi:hypothetical protein
VAEDRQARNHHHDNGEILHTPEEIAARLGGIAIKSLSELIRKEKLETTTLHFLEPSRRGGRRRRVWGMTEEQLDALLALRRAMPRAGADAGAGSQAASDD